MSRIADRNPVQHYTTKPIFQGAKVGLLKCMSRCADGSVCEWEFAGTRDSFQAAWTAHWRLEHSDEIGVVITGDGGTRLDDLLAMQQPKESIVIAR